MKNITVAEPIDLLNGYDLPVYGLADGSFYLLHVPAVICIFISFICANTTLIMCVRSHRGRSFFKWTECDRCIVFLAICDGCFNLPHGTDHMHVLIARNHVYPETLCHLYAFLTAIFATSQNILVGIIAINIFAMMYFHKKLYFGKYDWMLLLLIYGIPGSVAVAAWCFGFLGPNGVICLTDGVKGRKMFIFFFTVPLLGIFAINSVLYTLTWLKIRSEINAIRRNFSHLGYHQRDRKIARRVAKSMSMFVSAFFIQWWAAGLYGAFGLFGDIPNFLTHASVIFSNLGGVLNMCIYLLVRRKSFSHSLNHGDKLTKQDSCHDSRTYH